jgi:4-amino-4-deoxy-L-arabinose transferase-like glycosyltransferase
MALALTARERSWLALLVCSIVAVRLVTLAAYPLTDPTEARYGEIARKMLETGQWIMPQFEYGVPFWGKPPLSTWLSAASMGAFGVNEFAARLPSLLLMLGSGALVYALAVMRSNRDTALWSGAIFATTGLVFVAAGAVMTDPALTLGTTLAMAGFWTAVDGRQSGRWLGGYAFFVGLAIGLLGKGPVAVILAALPAGLWTLWTRRWRDVWARLPWVTGTALLALLVIPWYGRRKERRLASSYTSWSANTGSALRSPAGAAISTVRRTRGRAASSGCSGWVRRYPGRWSPLAG